MAALSNAFSGKLGNAKAAAVGGTPAQVNEVTRWKINPKIDAPKHCSNLTQGMKVPIVGAFAWSGTIDVMLQAGQPAPFQDGDFVDVQLHVDNTGDNYFSGTVLITGAPLDLDINGGKEVSVAYAFEGASALVRNGTLAPAIVPGSGSGDL